MPPVDRPWHRDQVTRLGLSRRAIGVRAINTQVATYMQAFQEENAYQQVKEEFCREVLPLVDEGAEVIIPASGLPMLLFAREKNFTVQGAVVLNGIAVVAAMAEAAQRCLCGSASLIWSGFRVDRLSDRAAAGRPSARAAAPASFST